MAVDTSLQRESQIRFLEAEIEHNQARLSAETADLVVFHENLKLMHTELVYETTRTNNEEPYCWSQGQVDAFCVEFKRQADDYTVRNSASHDLASQQVTMKQNLRKLLLKPVSPSPPPQPVTRLNLSDRGGLGKVDGLDQVIRPFSPSSRSASTLPPIEEEEDVALEQHAVLHTLRNAQCNEAAVERKESKEDVNPICASPKEKPKLKVQVGEGEGKSVAVPRFNSNARTPRLTSLEYRIDDLLQHMMHSEVDALCARFTHFILVHCVTRKAMRLLTRKLILHCVRNEPEFFGAKYAQLLQSLERNNIMEQHELVALRNADFKQLIWTSCADVFKQLQQGSDPDLFRNVMIVIAELLNANLVTSRVVLDCVFHDILCGNRAHLCENDFEGLYEILKRCYRVLVTSSNEQCLRKYFAVMDKEKHLPKFNYGTHRVRFMVNQMKALAGMDQRKYKNKRRW
eukprot:CAMPEP_0202727450 /NCGR_PEP_ID=MMETSP1385-20130828/185126_1 /ASSEMBLY_ACC=CAM_ASM_000861 /TAXON_ID=933848 /ORGANISM="Elphidium margaritaceum" /LENGTH=457 /DNA_ID=CAMNT_0049393689 /DNA_START=156 /DNA_END=1529 /DNA_ORIENTATION=-